MFSIFSKSYPLGGNLARPTLNLKLPGAKVYFFRNVPLGFHKVKHHILQCEKFTRINEEKNNPGTEKEGAVMTGKANAASVLQKLRI